MAKKACVVYAPALKDQADQHIADLAKNGFKVCVVEAPSSEVSEAAKGAEGIRSAIADCVDGAEVCIFLFEDVDIAASVMAGALGGSGASDRTCIFVAPRGVALNETIETLADSVLRVASDRLPQVLEGAPIWEGEAGELSKPRKIKRIECQ